jgi:hypothetical protein
MPGTTSEQMMEGCCLSLFSELALGSGEEYSMGNLRVSRSANGLTKSHRPRNPFQYQGQNLLLPLLRRSILSRYPTD